MRFRLQPILALLLLLPLLLAAEPFEEASQVMGLLKTQCIDCHGAGKAKAGLRLDSRAAALAGGENGPAAVPGHPATSLVVEVLAPEADPHMPPKQQLTDEEIALLAAWVRADLPYDAAALEAAPAARAEPRGLPAAYHPILAAAGGNIVAHAEGQSIVFRDPATDGWPELRRVDTHLDAVRALAWDDAGQVLLAGSYGKLTLHGPGERERERSVKGLVTAVAWQSNHWLVAVGDPGSEATLLLLDTDLETRTSRVVHADVVMDIEALSSGRVATASADTTVGVWRLPDLRPLRRLEGHTGFVHALASNADATRLASGGADRSVQIWDWAAGLIDKTIPAQPDSVNALAWSRSGKHLVVACGDGYLRRFPADKDRADKTSGHLGGPVVSLTRVGDRWFAGGRDGRWSAVDESLKTLAGDQPEAPKGRTLSFRADVLPVLNRTGCNTGECHARQGGQNGFQLTVFSFDPAADHRAVVEAAAGRRVFPASPEHSLLLRKPARLVAHEGGQRFAPGSPAWNLIRDWIVDGMAYELPDDPVLVSIRIPGDRTLAMDQTFPLKVTAEFEGGKERDVTDLAQFTATDPVMVSVDRDGVVRAGSIPGEGAVVARYLDAVAVCRVTIPPRETLPAEVFAVLPRDNLIDQHAWPALQALGLEPSPRCSDEVFLRRAALDIAGRLPDEATTRTFLADPGADKRARLVDELLRDPNLPETWAGKWADLLRPNPDRAGVKSVFVFDQWLRACFRDNLPMDEFARRLLTVQGNTHRAGPAVVYRDKRDPEDQATVFSRLFLGIRLECARCHQHPNERWSQRDFHQVAACFAGLKRKGKGVSPPISGDHETFWAGAHRTIKHPVTGEDMAPTPPGGAALAPGEGRDVRTALADWVFGEGQTLFAQAMVNRVWAEFFGRGFVEPVDDFRASNPAVHPALLRPWRRTLSRMATTCGSSCVVSPPRTCIS